MTTIDHVLLTRFNLPSGGVESRIRAEEGWLRNRVVLFETYTVPSVRAQTFQPFWMVYIDPESPDWLVERLTPLHEEGLLTLIRRDEVSTEDLLADARAVTGGATADLLMTTNLDNDDGLAVDFAERLRASVTGTERRAVYLANGIVRGEVGAYLHRDRHNAFCSVVEPWSGAVTCWMDWHNRLEKHMPVVEVAGRPAWLQVIHARNVSNRIRGRLVDPRAYRAAFPGLLDGVPSPSRGRVALDRFVRAPGRAAVDRMRGAVREGIVRVFGKAGLDRLKTVVRGGR